MTRLLEWLLDLEAIRLERDAPLTLRWDSPVPAWVLFGCALAGLGLIVLIHRRERVSAARRIVLTCTRCSLALLVGAVICRPSLVLQRDRVEPSHVVLAMDASLSMSADDAYQEEALAQSVARGAGIEDLTNLANHSRLSLIQAALSHEETQPLRRILQRHAIQLCTFANRVEARGDFTGIDGLNDLADAINAVKADGNGTDLAGAIRDIIDKAGGRRLAAIILAADGQSTHPTSLQDAVHPAQDRQIPLYPIRIGSPVKPVDVEVALVRKEERVFVNDVIAVEAQLAVQGLKEPTPITVRLVDDRTGDILTTRETMVEPGRDAPTVELRTKPSRIGSIRYRVETPALASERMLENNAERFDLTVLDDRLRVLYVDGYPRYEYRYLKNALLREATMEVGVLLLESDERFVQEGTDPIRRFPYTPEELNHYDVVLLGDVDPRSGWFSVAQMNMLLDFVGNEGGGFGLIAGERSTPQRWAGTPLEKLIPVRIDAAFTGHDETVSVSGFQPRLTPLGRRSRIFRFAADRNENDRLFESLPDLFWFARTLGAKPGASVLVEHPAFSTAADSMPIVVTGRYGAGKLFFQATDDTWRWRRHTGELLHDAYWVQAVRELMRGSRVGRDRRFVIRTDRNVYPYGQAVQAQVEVFDVDLLDPHRETFSLAVIEPAADSTVPSIETPAMLDRFEVHRLGPESNRFEGSWIPPRPGRFMLEVGHFSAKPGQQAASTPVRVEPPSLESRSVEADHEVMQRLADATGGRVADLDELGEILGDIRDRSIRIPDDVVEPLWDSRLVLALFAAMISMEWVLRKRFGLL